MNFCHFTSASKTNDATFKPNTFFIKKKSCDKTRKKTPCDKTKILIVYFEIFVDLTRNKRAIE
jgi:hypothetical protein